MYRQITRPALVRPISELEDGQIFIYTNLNLLCVKDGIGPHKVIASRVDNISAFMFCTRTDIYIFKDMEVETV